MSLRGEKIWGSFVGGGGGGRCGGVAWGFRLDLIPSGVGGRNGRRRSGNEALGVVACAKGLMELREEENWPEGLVVAALRR